jgi:hypothetical protein
MPAQPRFQRVGRAVGQHVDPQGSQGRVTGQAHREYRQQT